MNPALLGVLVSFASWCFLELVHWIQQGVYQDLPELMGFYGWAAPRAGGGWGAVGVVIVRLPGRGGHVPYAGMKAGATRPADLPGILLAAMASLGLGLVPGREGRG